MPRTRPAAALVAVLALVAVASGCSGDRLPGREPEVTGVVQDLELTKPSDRYFERLGLVGDEDTVVVDADGEPITTADLQDGDEVDVWVSSACAESYPVQCGIEAVRVRG
ncbi:hypothetical protein [Cellulomonas sp. NS3]|uniref:hypothetical protein n=1 Tax=Cellulomonas sp. NS3 TaxID=2973977 RepID=UPI00216379F4|nr:hypothetical protein [Cellulomonas sp. NS3]